MPPSSPMYMSETRGEPEVPTPWDMVHPNRGAFEPLAQCAAVLLLLSAGCAVMMKCSVLVAVRQRVTHDKKRRMVGGGSLGEGRAALRRRLTLQTRSLAASQEVE